MKMNVKIEGAVKLLFLLAAFIYISQLFIACLPSPTPSPEPATPKTRKEKTETESPYRKVISIAEETEKIGVRMVEDDDEDVTSQTFIGPIIYETFHGMGTKHTRCGMCHFDIEKGTLQEYIETNTDRINPFTGEPFERIESICTSCHRKLHLAHPVGIVPDPAKVILPPEAKGFRGEEDRLTCLSCHNHHPINKNYKYLRWPTDGGEDKAKFCAHCHPDQRSPDRIFDGEEFPERFTVSEKIRREKEPIPARNPYFKLPEYEIGQLYDTYQGATYNLERYNEAYHTKKELTDEEWSKTRAEELYFRGREELTEGNIEKAIKDLELAKLSSDDINQTNEFILLALGMAYRANSQFEKAKVAIKQALSIKPSIPEANFEMAMMYWHDGNLDDAFYHFMTAAKIRPNYSEAYLNMGRIHRENRAVQSAREMFEKTIRLKPDSSEAYVEIGKLDLEAGQNQYGKENFKKALDHDPHSSAAMAGLGESLFMEKDYTGAVDNYKNALVKNETANAYLGLGKVYLKLNENTNARDALIKAAEMDEKNPVIRYQLGLAYIAENLLEQSLQAFGDALELNENYAEAWYELGKIFLGQKKYRQSEESLKKALQLKPDYPEAYVELGRCYYQRQELPQAIAAYQEAIRLRPDYRDILSDLEDTLIAQCDSEASHCTRLGDFYLSQKRYDMAITPYLKVINTDHESSQSYKGLGITYLKLERYAEARTHLKIARKMDPDSPELHYYLGIALKYLGMEDEWRKELSLAVVLKYLEDNPGKNRFEAEGALLYDKILLYKTAAAIDPENPDTHNNLGTAYMIEGKMAQATAEYERALELRPDFPDYLLNIGLSAGSSYDYKRAESAYRSLLRIVPDHFQASYNLGKIYQDQDMLDEAIAEYRKIYPLRPQTINITLGHLYLEKWGKTGKRKWLIQSEKHFRNALAKNERDKILSYVQNLLSGKIQALIVSTPNYDLIKKIAKKIKKQIKPDDIKEITRKFSDVTELTFADEESLGKKLWKDLSLLKNGELSPVIFHLNRYFLFYRFNMLPEKSL